MFLLCIVLLNASLVGCEKENKNIISNENLQTKQDNDNDDIVNTNDTKLKDISEFRDERTGRYDIKGKDISNYNVPEELFDNFLFDSNTKWPDKLPDGYNIDTIIEYGKNPGLNVEKLHDLGITGKNI